MMSIDINYTELYRHRKNAHAYPNEFAIRTFLGGYPTLPSALQNINYYNGKSILDLGCGDGRNMPLFSNCGMSIFGTEVSEEACSSVMQRMRNISIDCDVRVGRSNNIPFSESMFDYVFASGVLSFVDKDDIFKDNLKEPFRVLKQDGLFCFYLLNSTSSQVINSEKHDGGYFTILNDPFNRINGAIVRAFKNREEIEAELADYFNIEAFGASNVDVYGFISINAWWLVCSKKALNQIKNDEY